MAGVPVIQSRTALPFLTWPTERPSRCAWMPINSPMRTGRRPASCDVARARPKPSRGIGPRSRWDAHGGRQLMYLLRERVAVGPAGGRRIELGEAGPAGGRRGAVSNVLHPA